MRAEKAALVALLLGAVVLGLSLIHQLDRSSAFQERATRLQYLADSLLVVADVYRDKADRYAIKAEQQEQVADSLAAVVARLRQARPNTYTHHHDALRLRPLPMLALWDSLLTGQPAHDHPQ